MGHWLCSLPQGPLWEEDQNCNSVGDSAYLLSRPESLPGVGSHPVGDRKRHILNRQNLRAAHLVPSEREAAVTCS